MSERPVRVGLLTYGLDRPLVGVSRVALELGRALLGRADCEVTFLTTYRRGRLVGQPGARSVYLPGCGRLPVLMALGGPLIALAARRLSLDVVHDPTGVSPFTLGRWAGAFRRVVNIHDTTAFTFPEGYPLANNLLHRAFVPSTLRNVDAVVTGSEHARSQLEARLRAVPRLRMIPNGVSAAHAPVEPHQARETAARHGLTGPYILYVGSFTRHKNLPRLIEAFARVRARLPGHRLALVGPSQWRYPELSEAIAALGPESGVEMVGYVSESDLRALYSAARLFVLPSLHEGFGLPVLEAMACGAPVVCSTADSLPEVAGDAALLFDPRDPVAMASAIERVATEPGLADDLRARGLRRAALFSWERTAAAYVDLYRELADSTARP